MITHPRLIAHLTPSRITHPSLIAHLDPCGITHPTALRSYPTVSQVYHPLFNVFCNILCMRARSYVCYNVVLGWSEMLTYLQRVSRPYLKQSRWLGVRIAYPLRSSANQEIRSKLANEIGNHEIDPTEIRLTFEYFVFIYYQVLRTNQYAQYVTTSRVLLHACINLQ